MRLHASRCGDGDVAMLLVHPNPLDHRSWLYQTASFGRVFTTIAVDLPGYGSSPPLAGPVTVEELARLCWDAVDATGRDRTVVVGSSIGSFIAMHMAVQRPGRVPALVLTGTGYVPDKAFVDERIAGYRARGAAYRWEHASSLVSEGFLRRPLGRHLLGLSVSPVTPAHVDSVIRLFDALRDADPPELYGAVQAPTLVVSGTEDAAHGAAPQTAERIAGSAFHAMPGVGHLCQLEAPTDFDAVVASFLSDSGVVDTATPLFTPPAPPNGAASPR